MVEIRLGYPISFTDKSNKVHYGGWFWGERGNVNEIYDTWSDRMWTLYKSTGLQNIDNFNPTGVYMGFMDDRKFFKQGLAETFIQEQTNFIIPISVKSPQIEDIEYLRKVRFPENVRNYIKKTGKAVIVLYDLEEASITKDYLIIFEEFCKHNDLEKQNVWVLTSNYQIKEYESRYFSIRYVNFFKEYLWFLKGSSKLDFKEILDLKQKFGLKPSKHFLCLNRRQDWERTALVGFLKTLPVESVISLGRGYEKFSRETGFDFVDQIRGYGQSFVLNAAIDWFKQQGNQIVLQSPDDDAKIYQNRIDCNQSLYVESAISIVTETYFEEKDKIFFSEKIFKPMFCLRPFILVGACGSLESLRQQGFCTFSKWWDESYDLEENPQKRLDLIGKVILDLSKRSVQDLQQMLEEMKIYLVKNYQQVLSKGCLLQFFDFLSNLGK